MPIAANPVTVLNRRERALLRAIAVAAWLAAGPALAEEAPVPPASAEITVTLVQVEVRVEDKKGVFAPGLTAADFEVVEDGRPQELQFVDEVHPETAAPERTSGEPRVLPRAQVDAPAAPRRRAASVILLVDRLNSARDSISRQKKYLQDLLSGLEGSESLVGVFELTPAGGFKMLSNFSRDLAAAKSGIEAIGSGAGGGAMRRSNIEDLESTIEQKLGQCDTIDGSGREFCLETAFTGLVNVTRTFVNQERQRAEGSMEAVSAVLRFSAHLPGSRSLVLISEGIDPGGASYFNVSGALMRFWGQNARVGDVQRWINELQKDVNLMTADALPRFDRVIQAANDAGVTVHWVNPSHQGGTQHVDPDVALGGYTVGSEIAQAIAPEILMKGLAGDTGGRSLVRAADLKDFFTQLARDINTYYVLSYQPARQHHDGAKHDLSVRVKTPGLKVRMRNSYVDQLPEVRVKRTLAAALDFPDLFQVFPMVASASFLRPGKGPYQVQAFLSIPYDQLAPFLRNDQVVDTIHFGIVVRDRENNLVHSAGPQVPIAGSHADFQRLAESGSRLEYRHGLALEPGDYTLIAAALDGSDLRSATARIDLRLPAAGAPCLTTSPLLLAGRSTTMPDRVQSLTFEANGSARWADLRLTFAAYPILPPTGKLNGVYQIVNAAAGTEGSPSVETFFRLFQGDTFINQTPTHTVRAYTDPVGASITSFYSVPYNNLAPGDYRLELYARDGQNDCSSIGHARFRIAPIAAAAAAADPGNNQRKEDQP